MSTPIAMHSMIASFEKNLHTNPTAFESKNKLYYLAAAVSGIAAAALLAASFFSFQTITTPFWVGLVGPVLTQAIGFMLGTLTCRLIQSAQEAQKTANCLKELQNTHKAYQNIALSSHEFSNNEKAIIPHCLLAKKEYLEAANRLEELNQNTNSSNFESKSKEIITLEYQMLILKIDLAFKTALLYTSFEGYFNDPTKGRDLLMTISTQDPLIQSQIRGLNNKTLNHFSPPLVCFEAAPRKNLCYNRVRKMSFDQLKKHISTVIQDTRIKT